MVLQVHDYAVGKQGSDTPSGNVVSECTDGEQLVHIPNLPGKTFKNSYIIHWRAVYNDLGDSMVCGIYSTEETLGGQS